MIGRSNELQVRRQSAHHHRVWRPIMCLRPGVLSAALVVTLFPVPSRAEPAAPDVPKEIAVPPGHKLLFKFEAKGVQIYKTMVDKAGKPEWVLEAPLADLFDGKA